MVMCWAATPNFDNQFVSLVCSNSSVELGAGFFIIARKQMLFKPKLGHLKGFNKKGKSDADEGDKGRTISEYSRCIAWSRDKKSMRSLLSHFSADT